MQNKTRKLQKEKVKKKTLYILQKLERVICLKCKSLHSNFWTFLTTISYIISKKRKYLLVDFGIVGFLLLLLTSIHVQTFNIYIKEDRNTHRNNINLAARNTNALELHNVGGKH